MKTVIKFISGNKYLIIVILICLPSVIDLANYGIPPTHDGEYHIMRFWQFYKVISSGIFYPRWAPDFNNGYGIPLFNYVYPLPNYFAVFLHFLGFSFIDSLKLNMAAASIVGAVFSYLWTRKYWGDVGGLVSSVFYTYSPYHFLDVYVRGSVGEVWSLALAPGLMWAYYSYTDSKKPLYFVVSCVFLGLLVYAHNILAVVFFGFFILYSLFIIFHSKNKKNLSINTFLICILGLGIAAPFWLPAIFETKFVQGLQIYSPIDYFPKLYQLVYSSWGYGFAGSKPAPGEGQMSFQVGIPNLLVVFLCLFLLLKVKSKQILIFFESMFFITLFFITPFSYVFWKYTPGVSFVQFPWRLLSLVVLLVAFLAGSLVQDNLYKHKRRFQLIVASTLIIISFGYGIRYAKEPFYHKRSDQHYFTRGNFTDGTNSPGNAFNTKWLIGIPSKKDKKIQIQGEGDLKINYINPQEYSFYTNLQDKSKILVNTAYFPGWKAYSNNKNIRVENYNGKIMLSLSSGVNNVLLKLGNTFIQDISYIYFWISILIIALLCLRPAIIKK